MSSKALSLLCLPLTIALGQVPPAKQTTLIKAGHVLDVRSGRYPCTLREVVRTRTAWAGFVIVSAPNEGTHSSN